MINTDDPSLKKGENKMSVGEDNLSQMILEAKLVPQAQLKEAEKLALEKKISLAEALIQRDLISDEQIGRLTADFLQVPFTDLSQASIPLDILRIIPEVMAKKKKIVAFKKDEKGLSLAMVDPTDLQTIEFIKKKSGLKVVPHLTTEREINNAFSLYTKDVVKAFDQIIAESIKKAKTAKGEQQEPPIIKIVDTIIAYAYQNKASDIHIEPEKKYSLVRFRIDGVLHDIVKLPADIHPQIVIRIKVMAKLRTDEHQAAQDGKMQYQAKDEDLDIRISVVPVSGGEKIVMRLLSERSRQFSLTDLGFLPENLEKVKQAYQKPFGMILATGPTGCGKTTTMYSVLKILNKRQVNIMTIEDPVEYDIEGVNQIQVNTKTGLTFAAGLRSIVRQDPDIVLVGEIRDEETAGIAINSAMTGHLILSTLHTNDAATAIPRLLDMKIEPFLVASSINIIVAQRLVRKICPKCRISVEIKKQDGKIVLAEAENQKPENKTAEKAASENKSDVILAGLSGELIQKHFTQSGINRIYRGKGCSVCHQTGFVGRIGIFETLIIDDQIREAIVSRKDASAIRQLAVQKGMKTMTDDGINKVKQGITTISEVIRVTKE